MRQRRRLLISALAAGLLLAIVGCDSNPTNEPSKQAIDEANAARAAAIDNDPKKTPEQKETMKRMMGLTKEGRGPAPERN
jgi:hypothetical protein